MKSLIQISSIVLFALVLCSSTAFAQNFSSTASKAAFYEAATSVNKEYPSLESITKMRPSTKTEATQRQILMDAKKLLNQVVATKGNLTTSQTLSFNRQLMQLEGALDLTFDATNGTSGNPPLTCHGRCESDFPGTGGGQGWKRFVCKMGCISIGPVHGGN
jgi:hypothetical protein